MIKPVKISLLAKLKAGIDSQSSTKTKELNWDEIKSTNALVTLKGFLKKPEGISEIKFYETILESLKYNLSAGKDIYAWMKVVASATESVYSHKKQPVNKNLQGFFVQYKLNENKWGKHAIKPDWKARYDWIAKALLSTEPIPAYEK